MGLTPLELANKYLNARVADLLQAKHAFTLPLRHPSRVPLTDDVQFITYKPLCARAPLTPSCLASRLQEGLDNPRSPWEPPVSPRILHGMSKRLPD